MDNARSRVVLTCGMAGSGKTTFARQLEAAGFVRLSIDDEVWRRISSGVLTPGSDTRLVRQGRDVVVDFSFPVRSSREAYRRIVEENGGAVELVYFRLPSDELHARARNEALNTARPRQSSRVSIDRYIPTFEEPADDEHPIVIDAYSGGVQ